MANVGSPARGNYMDRSADIGAIKDLFVKFVSGASGAVPTTWGTLGGIQTITKTGTGAYTVQFNQSYYQCVQFVGSVQQASYSASGACTVAINADASEAANGTVKFTTLTAAGAAVDMSAGDILRVTHTVQVDSITS